MSVRKALSKSIRFEVFKRDSFTCQYCGKKAPDVILVIDHIQPVSKDGGNDILNLITSCEDCNSGKSNKLLSDDTVIQKKRNQLEQYQAKKEQIELMYEWQKSMFKVEDEKVSTLFRFWRELGGFLFYSNSDLNTNGLIIFIKIIKPLVKKYEIDELMICLKISAEQYLMPNKYSNAANEMALKKIPGIAYYRKHPDDHSEMAQLFYIRAFMRNKMYVNENMCIVLLKKACNLGISIQTLKELAKSSKNWTLWREAIENLICKSTALNSSEVCNE